MTSMARPACGLTGVAWAALLATGCTMCPDPYDYSGPVPNGSPPHNDFRARSNGILPLGAAPKPWPPIVKTEPASDSPPERAVAAIANYSIFGVEFAGDDSPGSGSSGPAAHEDVDVATADAAAASGDDGPEPTLVLAPITDDADGTAATGASAEQAEAAEPSAPVRRTSQTDSRGLPSFREAARWLRWR